MSTVVPSQVVAFIDGAFRFAATQGPDDTPEGLAEDRSGVIRGLLHLLDALPPHLLRLDEADYVSSSVCHARG
jgi:hypothetical protein